jgi:hypothetical protein
MRAWVVAIVLGWSATARAIVISEPVVVMRCPGPLRWDEMTACLAKVSRSSVVTEIPGARLLRLWRESRHRRADEGLLLLVEHAGRWQIGGLYETAQAVEALDLRRVMIAGRDGLRVDIGEVTATQASFGGSPPRPATQLAHHVMFCAGTDWQCRWVDVACDVLVGGQSARQLRGTLKIEGTAITVQGDRRNADTLCPSRGIDVSDWHQPRP